MKKQLIDNIMQELVKITVVDYKEEGGNSIDKKTVDFKYYNHMTVNAVAKKCYSLCIRDWESEIIRDETYASIYEILLKVANDYTVEELGQILEDVHTKKLIITNSFLSSVYKLSVFKVKFNLSGFRRGSKGMLPSMNYTEYTEDTLNNYPEHNYGLHIDNPEENINFFQRFFNENKEQFLTKKQLAFIEDESQIKGKNRGQYRRRIYDSTLKAYNALFDSDDDRINEIRTQITIIENLLDSENFVQEYIRVRDKSFIIDAITTHVDMPTMRAFNLGNRDNETIKKHRVALFKKLDELNNLLD
jgi:hypothetical protein